MACGAFADSVANRFRRAVYYTGEAAEQQYRGHRGIYKRAENRGAIFLPAFALNMANAVIAGNLIGENRRRDAFRGGIITAMIGVAFISFLTLIVILNARNLSRFLSGNSLVVQESVRYLYIAMVSEPFMAWAVIIGGAINGAGDTRGVMRIVILSQWAVRLPLAYVLGIVFSLGPAAIWWSMNASILVHALLISRRYFRGKWVYHE